MPGYFAYHFITVLNISSATGKYPSSGCPRCINRISKSERMWLASLNVHDDEDHRQVRIVVDNKNHFVDGFDPDTNTVYEFYGDYWHGNPKAFKSSDRNASNKKLFGELYERTMLKEQILKDAGYNLVVIWEADWKEQCRNEKNHTSYY